MPTSFVKIPVVIKKMFPNYVWDISTTEKIIYLTFDDGPTPEITNWTLDTLKAYNAKATFFCIGNNVEKHPEIFLNILKEGHAIGNHTHNHLKGWKTKNNDYLANIKQAQEIFEKQQFEGQPVTTNLFRPPYGKLKPNQGKQLLALNYKIVMWDIISFDWDKDITEEQCVENVISKAVNGSVVVFHDSLKAARNMQYALPKVLKHFTYKGYRFEAIPN
ncbi:polysaccharide deacetylase family protein [Aestuariibaculum sp. M13]|uniref:polysaccharide deacetylase family protein n=1 Tax=Aestuariibaculum sp. M13 TaxID=2967132 RepID=UPI002159F6E9|nr:polysaccharide deacetylase family protein [Aestuariibaculum sp. M13]MCR8669487.1 polysaccharide deacetylase family protein [Aestuariibaculum sp. M13]